MRQDVENAVDRMRGMTLTAEEADHILTCVLMSSTRVEDISVHEVLVLYGLRFMKCGSKNKIAIARKWLLDNGVPEDQLDQLLVMAKLARDE